MLSKKASKFFSYFDKETTRESISSNQHKNAYYQSWQCMDRYWYVELKMQE